MRSFREEGQGKTLAEALPPRAPADSSSRCVCESLSRRGPGRLSGDQDRGEVPRAEFSETGAKTNCSNGRERKMGARRDTWLLRRGKQGLQKQGRMWKWLPWRSVRGQQQGGKPGRVLLVPERVNKILGTGNKICSQDFLIDDLPTPRLT